MAYNTIKIKKYLDVIVEYTATAVAITPGYLLELTSAGLVQAHSTVEGTVLPMFALEDELQGEAITDAYDASAKIQVWVAVRGEIVYALVNDGEDIAIGDFLTSAGNGKLQATTGSSATLSEYPQSIVGVALDAVDMSDSAKADPSGRIRVRII